jgi:lipopolysaccharide cholinephosphotransferase
MRLLYASKRKAGEGGSLSDEQVRQLQQVLLVLLDDMLAICRKYGLHFILIGGSAIGAVRHRGFIPWDDDLDTAMTRSDFEKFVKVIRTEYADKYTILYPQDRDNNGRIIPKLRLKGTEYRTILEWDMKDCGIFIDIFIIENVFNNPAAMLAQGAVSYFFGFALACRRFWYGRDYYLKVAPGMGSRFKCAAGALLSFASLGKWSSWTDRWHQICRNDHSKKVSIPTDDKHFFGGLYPRNFLCSYKEADFEGRKVLIPEEYDTYLTDLYGSYMELPPEEKRTRNACLGFDPGRYGKEEKENTDD